MVNQHEVGGFYFKLHWGRQSTVEREHFFPLWLCHTLLDAKKFKAPPSFSLFSHSGSSQTFQLSPFYGGATKSHFGRFLVPLHSHKAKLRENFESPPHPPRCRVLAGCWPDRMAFCRRLVKFSRLLPQSFCGLSIHMWMGFHINRANFCSPPLANFSTLMHFLIETQCSSG